MDLRNAMRPMIPMVWGRRTEPKTIRTLQNRAPLVQKSCVSSGKEYLGRGDGGGEG
jgi:hypothetical protein